MDLKQLQYFVVSVDTGSLKKASETLYISQPHISKTIKSLETELQVELLKRRSRGVEVTKAGRQVYEHACRILMEAGRIQNMQKDEDIHALCIASDTNDQLGELFRRFYAHKLGQEIHARYVECDVERVFQMLHHHTAEIGFVHVDEKQMTVFRQMLEYRHLRFQEFGRTSPFLLAGPNSPLYTASSVSVQELLELRYVQMEDEQDDLSIRFIQGNGDYQSCRSRGRVLTTTSRQMAARLILETDLCSISCGIDPESGGHSAIRRIPIRGTKDNIGFGCVQRKRDGISAEAERFAEYVKTHWK